MDLQRPLRVVTPTLDGDVLSVLARAEVSLTGRAVQRAIGSASTRGVQLVLARLVGQGIVRREESGHAHLYRLNRDHLAASSIEVLASLRLQLIDRLRDSVRDWNVRPAAAVLFGSAARGEAAEASDIDLLLVRPSGCDEDDSAWREQVARLEASTIAWTGNDTRVLEYGEDEAIALASTELVLRSAAEEGVELIGSLRLLRRRSRIPKR